MMGFFTAPKIAFGPGAIEQLSALGAQRALVVVGASLARADRHRRVVEELVKSDATVETVDAAPGFPTVEAIVDLSERVRAFGPDWIVAVGGGRTIDLARGLWVRYAQPDLNLAQVSPLVELGLRHRAGFVAIPTTSGSGQEASWVARFADGERSVLEVSSRELVPDWALLDPGLPRTMSLQLTRDTGADQVARAFEAVGSQWAGPFSDALAKEALSTAVTALPKVVRHPDDDDARAQLHFASTQSGIAVANAQAGLAHASALALAREFDVPYGRVVGCLLPYVLEFNFPAARDRYQTLAGALGPAALQNRATLGEFVRRLWDAVGVPRTLKEAGVDPSRVRSALPSLAERIARNPATIANPRVPSISELERLLAGAAEGTPVGF